jgi:polyhydroxybutyrate depolymerase
MIGKRSPYGGTMRSWSLAVSATVALALTSCSSSDGTDASGTPAAGSATEVSAAETAGSTEAAAPAVTEAQSTTVASTVPELATTTEAPTTTVDPAIKRPYDVFVPSTYSDATAMPLVLLLHGHGVTGDIQEAFFQFQPLAESRGFLYVHPTGEIGTDGDPYWNATDGCCARDHGEADDVNYLMAIISQVSEKYNVDPKRIYLAGHSNGGFMSYRMACDHAETIAAVVSLAGATWGDPAKCAPSEPVSVLQVHGTADDTVLFAGGEFGGVKVPGAQATVDTWATYNGCTTPATVATTQLDLDGNLEGNETDVATFSGCETGGDVALWSINGGAHIPGLTPNFAAGAIDFMFAHPKT